MGTLRAWKRWEEAKAELEIHSNVFTAAYVLYAAVNVAPSGSLCFNQMFLNMKMFRGGSAYCVYELDGVMLVKSVMGSIMHMGTNAYTLSISII